MKWFFVSLYTKVYANVVNKVPGTNAQKVPGNNVPDIPTEDIPTEIQPLPPSTGDLSVSDIIVSIIRFILSFAAALAVLMIIVGGIRYIVSGGNEDAVNQAKKIIVYAILGVVIITLSFVIVNFARNITPVIVP